MLGNYRPCRKATPISGTEEDAKEMRQKNILFILHVLHWCYKCSGATSEAGLVDDLHEIVSLFPSMISLASGASRRLFVFALLSIASMPRDRAVARRAFHRG